MPDLPDAEPLITLLALHEAGSESVAAEALGIGQSSVSRRIATLQRLSQEPLTVRTATGTKLTDAGERLLPYAREVRSALSGAARWLAGDGAGAVKLRVGVDPDLVPRFAGRLSLLGETGGQTDMVEDWSRGLVEAVRRRDLDAAVVLWAPAGSEPGLTSEALGSDDLSLVAAAGTRLTKAGSVDADALRGLALLVPPTESEVTGRARAELRAAGLEPADVLTLPSPAAVRAGVAAGAGVGVTLASAFGPELAAGWLTSVRLGPAGCIRPRLVVSDGLPHHAAEAVRVALGQPPRAMGDDAPED